MSTPNPPNSKLEGLDLYASRGAQTSSARGSQDPPSQTFPDASEYDPPRADSKQPAAASELLADTPVGNQTTLPSRDQEPSVSAYPLPPAPKLRFQGDLIDELPPPSNPPGSLAILIRPRRDVCLSIRKMCRSHRPACGPTSSLPY